MKNLNYNKGKGGENTAKAFLEKLGFECLDVNYKNDIGEIDLIMEDGETLVFVEVKFKSDDKFGRPEEMISNWKINQVRRVAEVYLLLNPKIRQKYNKHRIDAVCILGNDIRHYKNLY